MGMLNSSDRRRGLVAYRVPEEVGGPPAFSGPYAMVIRDNSEGLQIRMVHTEGVAYLVKADKPWCWTDYSPDAKRWTVEELLNFATPENEVDLADWIRTFGDRLESNFWQVVRWCEED